MLSLLNLCSLVSAISNDSQCFSLDHRGLAGEPHHIKCTLNGSEKVRLGEKWDGDIQVDVKDKHGNDIKKVTETERKCLAICIMKRSL